MVVGKMRAVAYCRVSTNDPTQLNSLENQMEHYTELFKRNNFKQVKIGMLYSKERGQEYVEGIFADEGITGTKKKNRKAFEYMMKCASRKEFDVIYCKNIARFARNVADGANDLKLLKSYGINVIFEDGNLNYKDHEFIVNSLLNASQEESRAKGVACRFGIRKAQEQGKWTSNTPYGYDRVDGYLCVNEKEEVIVRKIYEFYTQRGWGHNKILKWLNDENIPTKKGVEWWQQHIKHILTNPIYKGIQTSHKTENEDVNIRSIKQIPQEEWIIHVNENLRIISDDVWQMAQDIDKRRFEEYKSRHRHSDTNLFSTICICGNCGGILRRKKQKTKVNQVSTYTGKYEWVCQNNDMKGVKACAFRNKIDEDILLEFVKEKIQGYREHKEVLDKTLERYLELYYSLDSESQLNSIKAMISQIKSDINKAISLNIKGTINEEELEGYVKDYRMQLSEYETEERKLKNIDNEVIAVKRKYKNFVDYLNNINLDNLTNADLKKVFSRIVVCTSTHVDDFKEGYTYESYNKLKEEKYSYYNKNKGEIKWIKAEHLFLDIEEDAIYADLIDKERYEGEVPSSIKEIVKELGIDTMLVDEETISRFKELGMYDALKEIAE
jgi:site-specific DNA recombinase